MRQLARNLTIGSLFLGLQILGLGQSITLSIGSGSGTAGTTVSLPINLASSGGAQTAGLQWSFAFSSDITSVTVVAGPSATNAGKSLTCSGNNCLILGFNSTAMADGTVATATFQVASNPSTTSIPVQITGVVATTAAGNSIPASGGSGTISLPTPPPTVSVSVSPPNATLTSSQSTQFTATVTGSANTSVTWSMTPSVGSLLSNGLYTAPSAINSAQSVTITATSVADATKSASATVQLTPPPSVSVSVSPPNATLTASQSTQFTAIVTGSANTSVNWSMTPLVGSLLSNGFYTAPSVINSAQSVTITATSVADPTKSASATVQLTPTATVSVSVSPPSATVSASQTRQFTATVTGSANTSVNWSMTPLVGSLLSNGLYTAPSVINTAQSVTITATSVADPTKSASATVQLTPTATVSVSVSPPSATLSASQTRQFTATVTGNANTSVTWSMTPSVGSLSNGLYTAPSAINSAQSVTITATSVADPTKSASATVQLTPTATVSVSVSPPSATLTPSQSTQFTATVTGSANTSVNWSMTPSVGSLLSNGSYTAPSVINSGQSVTITATSVADPTKSASATVQLTPTVSVSVSPPNATLTSSQSTQFTATVTGSVNTSVNWSMTPSVGSLLSNGSYTAPSVISSAQSVTITATSVADATKSASATIQLTPAGSVSVSVSPPSATLSASQSTQFTATVTGSVNTSVNWSMTPSVGSLLSNGSYTAPSVISSAQSVTITATSVADPTKSASATVQLTPTATVSVSLNPPTATLTASQTRQFTATVTGNANTSVTWSMTPSVGSLSNGSYTAPSVINAAQSVTITATSVADPTKSASATVQLAPAGSVSVGVNPPTATLTASQATQFTATVTGSANTSVTWSLTPPVGSLSNGLYSAPSAIGSAQSVTITATSVADPTKSASATVQLTPGGNTPPPGTLNINITSPTTQSFFVSSQGTISLAGTASANAVQVNWTTDQGIQGQALGTANWSAGGIVLRNGSNRITMTARDNAGNQISVGITVLFSATSILTSLPDAQMGQPYSSKMVVLGGSPPFTWSAGSMPDGLTLSPAGVIGGTPSAAGTFTINVTVLDSLQVVTTAAVKLRIDNGLGLLSAASLQPGPVAPDSMVTMFGGELAPGVQSATANPLPTTLGGCTVTVTDFNGVVRAAGLYYVSPNQINFDVPTNAAAGSATVTVTCGAQTQTFGSLTIAAVAPGLFFLNSDQLAAADLTRVSGNNTTYEAVAQMDPVTNLFVAAPIDLGSDTDQVYLTLYGTGIRNRSSLDAVKVLVANVPVAVDFAGASTTSDGLDLVHVLLPKQLRGTGTANIVVSVDGVPSNAVTVVIK